MSKKMNMIEKNSIPFKALPLMRAVVLGLGLAVMANLSVSWAHGSEKHDAPKQAALSQEQEAVVKALTQYAAAFQSKDMDQIEKYVITDDGFSSIEGTFVDQGWSSFKKHLSPELALFQDPKYSFNDIKPHVMGDMAYATMGYTMSLTILSDQFENGKHHIETKGMATMVLVKDDGAWKIQHMHTVAERARDEAAGEKTPH